MPEFVLHRNYSLRSLMGHIIDFKKGQPTYVPPACAREAAAIGAECVDAKVDVLDPEAEPPAPMDPDARRESIVAAFQLMEERQARGDFTASGHPKKAALEKLLGFDIDGKEFEPMWAEYVVAKDLAE